MSGPLEFVSCIEGAEISTRFYVNERTKDIPWFQEDFSWLPLFSASKSLWPQDFSSGGQTHVLRIESRALSSVISVYRDWREPSQSRCILEICSSIINVFSVIDLCQLLRLAL